MKSNDTNKLRCGYNASAEFFCICIIFNLERIDELKTDSWNDLCNELKRKQKMVSKIQLCKKCIWANKESGKILCTRYNCVKERSR